MQGEQSDVSKTALFLNQLAQSILNFVEQQASPEPQQVSPKPEPRPEKKKPKRKQETSSSSSGEEESDSEEEERSTVKIHATRADRKFVEYPCTSTGTREKQGKAQTRQVKLTEEREVKIKTHEYTREEEERIIRIMQRHYVQVEAFVNKYMKASHKRCCQLMESRPCTGYNNNICEMEGDHIVDGVKRAHVCRECYNILRISLQHLPSCQDCPCKMILRM